MKIFERIYDNPLDKDGKEKPNKFLGNFKLLEGDMNDYSYKVVVEDEDSGEIYQLIGKEISGFYYPNEGGTKHFLTPLENLPEIKAYRKYILKEFKS